VLRRLGDLEALVAAHPAAAPSRVSVCTFSRPSFFIASWAHAIARFRLSEPLMRWP
jgi:hypothetical protein